MKYNKLLWKMKVNQLLIRLGLREPDPIWYIGGSDVLPQPLPRAKEREVLEAMKNGDLGPKAPSSSTTFAWWSTLPAALRTRASTSRT